jgi:hypothetical protein
MSEILTDKQDLKKQQLLSRAIYSLVRQFRASDKNKNFFQGVATLKALMEFVAKKAKRTLDELPVEYILEKIRESQRIGTFLVGEETYYYAIQGTSPPTHALILKWLTNMGLPEETIFKPVPYVKYVAHMTSERVKDILLNDKEPIRTMRRAAVHGIPAVYDEDTKLYHPDTSLIKKATDEKKRYEVVIIINFAKLLEMKATGQWEGFIWINNAGVIQITANIPNNLLLLPTTLSFSEFWSKKDVTNDY